MGGGGGESFSRIEGRAQKVSRSFSHTEGVGGGGGVRKNLVAL